MDNQEFPILDHQDNTNPIFDLPMDADAATAEAHALEALNEKKGMKKAYSRMGWSVFAVVALWPLLANLAVLFLAWLFKQGLLAESMLQTLSLVLNEVTLALCMLLMFVIIRPDKGVVIQPKKISFSHIWWLYCTLHMVGIAGNIISQIFNLTWSVVSGSEPSFNLGEILESTNPLIMFLMVAVVGPLLEELIFRKLLIDKTVKYGETEAVLVSAMLFALFHSNFSQLFYAFGAGLILGYVYVKCGNIWISYGMHAAFNAVGAINSMLLPNAMRFEETVTDLVVTDTMSDELLQEMVDAFLTDGWALILLLLMELFMVTCFILGCVNFFKKVKKTKLQSNALLKGGEKAESIFRNPGMIATLVICLITLIYSLFI